MKLIIVALCIALLACGTYAKSFNNHVNQNTFMGYEIEISEDEPVANETWVDFYYGIILGWQTQQKVPGQCHTDTTAFYTSLNATVDILLRSYLPSNWFNFADRVRINIDSLSKKLQSCQVHSILTKLQRIVTANGIIETAARLLTQVGSLQNYFSRFSLNLADGNMTVAGTQVGLMSSIIVGVTVN